MPLGLAGAPPLDGPSDEGCEFCPRCPVWVGGCGEKRYALTDVGGGHMTACDCGGAV